MADRFVWQPDDIVIIDTTHRTIITQALQPDPELEPAADPEDEQEIELDAPEELSEDEALALYSEVLGLLEDDGQSQGWSLARLARLFAPSATKKPGESYERALARIQRETQDRINGYIRAWSNGHAPYDTAQRMASALREGALRAAQLGKLERGEDGPLSKAEQKRVKAWVDAQRKYLKGVNKYMRQTLDKHLPPKKATAEEKAEARAKSRKAIDHGADVLTSWRMPLYVNGLRAVYEQHRQRFPISIWPRSGDTECKANCYCKLEWGNDDQGPFVIWQLGEPETAHCLDCPSLAAHGKYREGEL